MTAASHEQASACAMAAGVNFVACGHYWGIWLIRRQELPHSYHHLRATVGRTNSTAEIKHDDVIIYAQEVAVDSLRYSDWSVTLLWMVYDLHRISYKLTTKNPWFSRELNAFLQPITILFASMWRFYMNEVRPTETNGILHSPPTSVIAIGSVSFLVSTMLFTLTIANLLSDVAFPSDYIESSMRNDAGWLFSLTLVWIGYPLVAIMQRVLLWKIPGHKYSATVSLLKD